MTAGADVHIKFHTGANALYISSWYGHVEVVKLLLGAKSEINIQVNAPDEAGMSPVYVAAKNGHKEVIKELIGVWEQCGKIE